MQSLIKRASLNPARIIFPEGQDRRIQEAAKEIKRLGIAEPILFIPKTGSACDFDFQIIDPSSSSLIDKYMDIYCAIRKNKPVSKEKAREILIDNSVFVAALMVKEGLADALIAGASHTTKDVAKAVIYCIGPKGGKSVSSCFLMDIGISKFGYEGKFIFADSGIIISPSSKQLSEIAIDAGELFKKIFVQEPYIALLSYSTHGSASGESVDKIREAVAIIKSKRPDLKVDGEIQADAAVAKEVAMIKCPNSPVAGKANVLIFPDLNSGNICYKIVDRFLGAKALGPIFLGTESPASDLSRGCEVEEIILDAAAISIMAQLKETNS